MPHSAHTRTHAHKQLTFFTYFMDVRMCIVRADGATRVVIMSLGAINLICIACRTHSPHVIRITIIPLDNGIAQYVTMVNYKSSIVVIIIILPIRLNIRL